MDQKESPRIGLMLPGKKGEVTAETSRVKELFKDLYEIGINAELILFNNEDIELIEQECKDFDLIQVWVNPIHDGSDRSHLDEMLTRLSQQHIKIATHPQVILKLGTKDILYTSQNMDWGCETIIYRSFEEFKIRFQESITTGIRVLKQYRGNGGQGVWKVQKDRNTQDFLLLHAIRGSNIQRISEEEFFSIMEPYFIKDGHLIDQQFQTRIQEGMIRVYMSLNKVIGFGHQFVTALIDPPGDEPLVAPPRLYYGNDKKEFQALRNLLENKWIAELQELLDIETSDLPLLWDTDFLLGPKNSQGDDTYVLCEINVSSVYPYPEVANSIIIDNMLDLMGRK